MATDAFCASAMLVFRQQASKLRQRQQRQQQQQEQQHSKSELRCFQHMGEARTRHACSTCKPSKAVLYADDYTSNCVFRRACWNCISSAGV